MGIQGLLPLLKSIHEHRKISEFKGQTLAVDAYVWLHRGAYGCAPDLVKGIPTTRYVDYAMHRVRLLKHHNITPYIVFDGGPLPAKQGTESSRLKSRQENREKGLELSRLGRHSEARDCFVKAVDVTPEMAYQLIKALKAEGVAYVVAPYEADAQMAFLEHSGIVDGIITEDSDLLVFGCKKVIFKLDSDGNCVCIRRENFARVVDIPLHSWSDREFREMAMLSGCDYLPSIQGLGLKTSHKLLRKHKTVEGVLNAIRAKSSHKIPPNYLNDFRTAELAFMYQRVFDPQTKRLIHMTSVPESLVDWNDIYVGKELAPETAHGIADGSIHPFTCLPMPDINPAFRPEQRTITSFTRSKTTQTSIQMVDMKEPKNRLTNYFTSAPAARKLLSDSIPDRPASDSTKENSAIPRASVGGGKRTLTSEHDFAQQILREREEAKLARRTTTSKFFGASQSNTPSAVADPPTPSLPDPPPTIISLVDETEDIVTQEVGYLSPTKSVADLIDVSSPPSSREPSPDFSDEENPYSSSDDADDVPSPQHARRVFTDNPASQSVIYLTTPNTSYPSFPTPQSPSSKALRSRSDPVDLLGSATTLNSEPNIASIRLSQGSSSAETDSQSLSQPYGTPFTGTPIEEMYIDSSLDDSSFNRPATDVPTPLARFAYAPTPRTNSAEMGPTSGPIASTTLSLNTPPRAAPSQTLPSTSSSWGPDLQDLFSPARSEVESVTLDSDVPSPERSGPSRPHRKLRTPSPHDSEDEVDVFLTPRKETNFSRGSDVEDVLDEEECDEPVFLGARTASARKDSVEEKWREKWALAAPSFTKRKTEVISPRTEPQSKRSSQWDPRADGATSPSPPERRDTASSTTTGTRGKQGPRRSLPAPPALNATAFGPRKPLPRRNAMTFPAPITPANRTMKRRTSSGDKLAKSTVVDLDAFRHQPLRLR